jgi:hypothetical protein
VRHRVSRDHPRDRSSWRLRRIEKRACQVADRLPADRVSRDSAGDVAQDCVEEGDPRDGVVHVWRLAVSRRATRLVGRTVEPRGSLHRRLRRPASPFHPKITWSTAVSIKSDTCSKACEITRTLVSLVISTWNTKDMSEITSYNDNPKTPTNCHGSIIQCHVRDGKLTHDAVSAKRRHSFGCSAQLDSVFFAACSILSHWSELEVGSLRWLFGDVHLYQEESHLACAKHILSIACQTLDSACKLCYNPSVSWTGAIPEFKASDFTMVGDVPDPIVTIRPKLL